MKYKNTKTGKIAEMPEAQYEELKHQGVYVPYKTAPKKKTSTKEE